MAAAVTICHDCRHHRFVDTGRWFMDYHRYTWWNQMCAAAPRPPAIDFVTGKEGFGGVNDLGGQYVGDQPFAFCREVNRCGACPMFEPKE